MKKEIIADRDPKSPISEVFRTLRTNIQFMNSKKDLQVLLVTSTVPGEGKSWVSSNLATTFAQAGKKTLLIDGDMRKGRLHKIFGADSTPGLSNLLACSDKLTNKELTKYIRTTGIDNLFLIPAGNVPPNPSELLADENTEEVIDKLTKYFDFIIIDGTPSILVTDAIILSRIVDTTVIVSEYNETRKENLLKVKKSIENVGGKIAGVIINKIPVNVSKYNSRYYYSAQGKESSRSSGHHYHTENEERITTEENNDVLNELRNMIEKENDD